MLVSEYPKELSPFPPLFEYPLFSPPIRINGELIYDDRHAAAFILYQAYFDEPKAIDLTLRLQYRRAGELDKAHRL